MFFKQIMVLVLISFGLLSGCACNDYEQEYSIPNTIAPTNGIIVNKGEVPMFMRHVAESGTIYYNGELLNVHSIHILDTPKRY